MNIHERCRNLFSRKNAIRRCPAEIISDGSRLREHGSYHVTSWRHRVTARTVDESVHVGFPADRGDGRRGDGSGRHGGGDARRAVQRAPARHQRRAPRRADDPGLDDDRLIQLFNRPRWPQSSITISRRNVYIVYYKLSAKYVFLFVKN